MVANAYRYAYCYRCCQTPKGTNLMPNETPTCTCKAPQMMDYATLSREYCIGLRTSKRLVSEGHTRAYRTGPKGSLVRIKCCDPLAYFTETAWEPKTA